MDFISYSERLGLGFDDNLKQQVFLNKMSNIINDQRILFPHEIESAFASEIGLRFHPSFTNDIYHNPIEVLSNAWYYIGSFHEFKHKLAAIISLINILKKNDMSGVGNYLLQSLMNALETSHILFNVENDEDGTFVFPKGDPILDDGEVLRPLILLEKYPKAKTSFQDALKAYNNLDESNASNVADLFRKALEAFFQEFFHSERSLEHFKSEYGNYIKSKSGSAELAANFVTLLSTYTNYNNNYAKHHDRASALVLEYLLYETGNIIRLLITLRNEEEQPN